MSITVTAEVQATIPAALERPEGLTIVDVDGVSYRWQLCRRCGGSGRFSFNLMDGDLCYGCHRRGGEWVEAKVYDRRAKQRAARARKAAEAAVVREAQRAARFAAAVEQAHADALAEAPEQEARLAAKAARPAYPAGVQTVEAKVISIQLRENPYAYRSSTFKLLAELDHGYRVWLTCPAALLDADAAPGDRVRFTAGFEASDRDAEFGFGSRARKASVIERADA
jgi:predicted Fe-S protein YdhL (DUF1289 family)